VTAIAHALPTDHDTGPAHDTLRTHSFSVRSPFTACMLNVCSSYFSVVLGIHRSRPNFNAWHFFCFSLICDTCRTIVPFQYLCIAVACSQVPYYVDVTTATSFTFHGPVAGGAYCCNSLAHTMLSSSPDAPTGQPKDPQVEGFVYLLYPS
jgi:hypothetical protein